MSVDVKAGSTLDVGMARPLFQTGVHVDRSRNQYVVTGDGRRFLALEGIEQGATPMMLVVNWTAGLGR
jgi:hypothetical protein